MQLVVDSTFGNSPVSSCMHCPDSLECGLQHHLNKTQQQWIAQQTTITLLMWQGMCVMMLCKSESLIWTCMKLGA
jgi:hypothetical protein